LNNKLTDRVDLLKKLFRKDYDLPSVGQE